MSLGEFFKVVDFLRLDLADYRDRICTIAVINMNREPYKKATSFVQPQGEVHTHQTSTRLSLSQAYGSGSFQTPHARS
jgi:hypothetical protein